MTHFNSTQLKCYILLKFIKKEKIQDVLQEESLTTYHCKTCMLYMIENTPADFWVEDNLLTCLYNCLQLILKWAKEKVCPNYFIPDENMFDGRVNNKLLDKLCLALEKIIEANFLQFFLSFKTDKLGYRLAAERMTNCISSTVSLDGLLFKRKLESNCLLVHKVLQTYGQILENIKHKDIFRTLKELNNKILLIKQSETICDHTREETKRAISFLKPYIDLSHMSLFVVYANILQLSTAVNGILRKKVWNKMIAISDPFSTKLKQSSLLCMLGYNSDSLKILLALDNKINDQFIPYCPCSG